MSYSIYRIYEDRDDKSQIRTNLTLEEAQAHCNNPETSSSTCTDPEPVRRTKRAGRWFDAYVEE